MRNNCLWEYLYCLKKTTKIISHVSWGILVQSSIANCSCCFKMCIFWAWTLTLSTFPLILSRIEVWPRPPAGSGCPCPCFGSLSCCETQTLDETKSRVLQIISTCQHNSIFFFKPESGFLCTRLQNSPTARRSRPPACLPVGAVFFSSPCFLPGVLELIILLTTRRDGSEAEIF